MVATFHFKAFAFFVFLEAPQGAMTPNQDVMTGMS